MYFGTLFGDDEQVLKVKTLENQGPLENKRTKHSTDSHLMV